MILLLDIGNTRSKYVTSTSDVLSAIQYIDTALITKEWLSTHVPELEQCVIANVNQKAISAKISQWCQDHGIICQVLESEHEKFGVKCAYQNPKFYGVDRWLALLGAQVLFPQKACLIIDSGTATTLDVISADGEHLGGWILSGIDLLTTSILANTQNIIAQPQNVKRLEFANNSSDAISQAPWAATIGMIHHAIAIINSDYGIGENELELVLTGGNSQQLSELFSQPCTVVENLIFIGMQRYT